MFNNNLFSFSVTLVGRHNKKSRLMPKIFDIFLDFTWYNFLAFVPLLTLTAIVNPKSPDFISSVLLPNTGAFRWIFLTPCVMFQAYYFQMLSANAFIFIYFGFGYIFPGIIVLKQIRYAIIIIFPLNVYRM